MIIFDQCIRRHPGDSRRRFIDGVPTKRDDLVPLIGLALQDWGARFLLSDGTLTGTSTQSSAEANRVHSLVGRRIPKLRLSDDQGFALDPVEFGRWTVLYCFPAARGPNGGRYPPTWNEVPGAIGCTLESRTFRDQLPEFSQRGIGVHGVSTQRPDELADFAAAERLGFSLLSDQHLELTSALRLPTFRADGVDRIKRLSLLVDESRTIRSVLYPIVDPAASVSELLERFDSLQEPAA